MLRDTRIIILDEATSSIDFETDRIIQKAIRTEFQSSTILTIAHRLDTILDCMLPLLLSRGAGTDFVALLRRSSSSFGKWRNYGIRYAERADAAKGEVLRDDAREWAGDQVDAISLAFRWHFVVVIRISILC